VRQALGSTIGTGDRVYRGQGIMGTTAITASLGMFALRMWGHEYFLLYTCIRRANAPVWIGFLLKRSDYIGMKQ